MNEIERLRKLKTLFTLEGYDVMTNIEQVGCDKMRAINKEVEATCAAMKAQLSEGECDKHIHKYAKENGWDKGEMLAWISEEFGPLAELCVLYNGYNGQVCNGGHDQYISNDYASGNWRGFCGATDETFAHERLIELMRQYGEIALQREVLFILNDLEVVERMYDCDSCGGAGEHEEYDDDGDHCDTYGCDSCDGTGETNDGYTAHRADAMDDKWYAINEEAEAQMEALFVKLLG